MKYKNAIVGILAAACLVSALKLNVHADSYCIDEFLFPDANFRTFVKENYDKDDDNYLSSEEISAVESINVDGMGITSLDGIDVFTNLIWLSCTDNSIKELNLVDNTNLQYLYCYDNDLEKITFGFMTNLKEVNCRDNSDLTSLDLSDCPALKELYMQGNEISSIDLSSNTALEILNISCCEFTTIDLSYNTALKKLICDGNGLTSLNLSSNRNLTYLNCSINELSSISLTSNTALTFLNVENNNIGSLNVKSNTALETLYCGNCGLSSLNVSKNKALVDLDFNGNSISSINLKNNTELQYLNCSTNRLTGLDLSKNTKLVEVQCFNNPGMSTLSIVNNPTLISMYNMGSASLYGNLIYGEEITLSEFFDLINNNQHAHCITINNKDRYFKSILYVSGSLDIQVPAPTATPAPSSAPTAAPTSTPSSSSGMVAFAERLYTEALGRSYDASGRDYWVSQLRSGLSGADAARQFFFSAEFTNANYSDEVYVTRLYRTFMGRTPDAAGISYWVSQLTSGAMTREDVFNGFVNSTEWANLCLQSGIVSGGTQAPSITVEPSAEVTAFATRLYTTCLGRAADAAGVSWWATELANMRRTGTTAAQGFFFSDEYVSAGHSDAEFVTALYRTFMGRECDQAGYDYWMSELASGCSREDILVRFAGCDEFGNICADAGIIR